MNLIIIAAFIAVCGAAKLDRTYLPPASAKTAGGSPGSLQTPLQNSLGNNGLGGLPKGSFTNDFEGVVVDAAAAGTRASGSEDTGLGAPRLSYGSINSKVGAAGFKTNENAFNNDGQSTNNQRFQSAQGSNFQTGGAERPRAALDRAANTLRFENEVGPESYSYAFETDNGITAEENGVATNGVQAQGGFSYTGDDGQVYSVSYTADEGGYQPKGDHLPTPPPIPEEILRSLEQNARDEAAGLIDDGSYDAQKYNAGSDYSESNNAQGKFSHQSFKFGQVDATGSGSFISQSNQPFRPGVKAQEKTRHQGFSGQVGHSQGQGHESLEHGESPNRAFGTDGFEEQKSNEDRIGATSNRFGSGSSSGQTGFGSKQPQAANRFSQTSSSRFEASNPNRQIGQSGFASAQSQTNGFGSSASAQSSQGFGNRNEYLPPTNGFSRPQNGRPQSSRPQVDSSPDSTMQFIQEVNTNEENTDNFVALSQQKLQEQKQPLGTTSTSYNQPISGISGQSNFGTNVISSQNPSSNNGRLSNRFGQGGQSSQASASFGSRKEYLPPTTGSNQNRFLNQPSASSGMGSQFNQQSSQSDTHSPSHQNRLSHSSTASSQSAFGSQQFNGFEKPQATSNEKQRLSTGSSPFSSAQSILDQKATAEPQTELTTPFESSADSSSAQSQTTTSDKVLFDSSPSNRRPSQTQFGNQFYPGLSASPTQPSSSALPSFGSQIGSGSVGQTQAPAFPTQATRGQFIQQSQFNQQSQGAQNNDAQYSASTQRPSINQQQQGSDDSYYYNQPSQPFNTPQSSRFPSVPSNQFNRVGQGAQSNPQLTNARQDVSAGPFVAQSGNYQGSSKYPRPPTVAPTAFTPASTQSQYQSSGFNGITQASISPFPSQAPTQSSQFNTETQFDSRPQTSNQFDQNSRKPLFGQQTTLTQSLFGSQSGPQSSKSQQSSLQNQAQAQTFGQQDLNRNQPGNDDTSSPSVATQQYDGEIYDYAKPTQTLPAPEDAETTSGQFGQKKQTQFSGQSRPQMGQDNEDSQSSTNSQFSQIFETTKPDFGAQTSVPQFGQNNFAVQNAQQQPIFGSRSQFGQPARTPFGQTASAQATFGLQSTSTQGQSEQTKFASPSRPSSQSQTENQENSDGSQFGFGRPCCQSSIPNSGSQPLRSSFGAQPTRPSFGAQPTRPSVGTQSQFGQSQFGSQSTFLGAQGTGPTTSSFAGQGEVFDASRKPPATSFDSETGYHY